MPLPSATESTPASGRVVPDSNVVIALLAGKQTAAARLDSAEDVLLAAAVLGELRYGALSSGRPAENLARLDEFASLCRFVPIDEAVTAAYAEIRVSLKRRGRPIPENDIWIAATAKVHGAVVLTNDAHFEHVEGVTVESLR